MSTSTVLNKHYLFTAVFLLRIVLFKSHWAGFFFQMIQKMMVISLTTKM